MKLRVEFDNDPDSPREWDNLGKMVCFHRRYDLGDEHDFKPEDFPGWDGLENTLRKEEGAIVILPLYLFDHSGLSMSTGSGAFRACDSAGWDWGQVGFIYATREDILKEFGKKRLSKKILEDTRKILEAEVELYDKYLSGQVYGFVIEDEDGDVLESCWGFYDEEECRKEGESLLAQLEEKRHDRTPPRIYTCAFA